MLSKSRFLCCAALVLPVIAAEPGLVVDRGLPQSNLNTPAGDLRSNVRWSWYEDGFIGDDFTIGAPGERWVIDSIRTWTVPGTKAVDPNHLGDLYQDVRLYFGASDSDAGLSPVATAVLSAGSEKTSNSNIVIAEASRNGVVPYDEFGANFRVWQVEFKRLDLGVEGGATYRFGVWGMGRTIPGGRGKRYAWFNHASNAPLSAVTQHSADGGMLLFDTAGRFKGEFNGNGAGWDKASDINVQVFAHRIDAATAAAQ